LSPFSELPKGYGAPHAIPLIFVDFFWIATYVIPLSMLLKRNLIPFGKETKGRKKLNLSNRVRWVFLFAVK